jgi:acetyl-CoA C-acetyltransferase
MIASGAEDVVLACGVENMSLLPIGSDAIAGAQAGMGKPITPKYRERYEFTSQFEGAERIASTYGITRHDTDSFGLESQLRAAKAIAEGRFNSQLIPVEVPLVHEAGEKSGQVNTVTLDEVPRQTSMEALAGLKPVARHRCVTAQVAAVCRSAAPTSSFLRLHVRTSIDRTPS